MPFTTLASLVSIISLGIGEFATGKHLPPCGAGYTTLDWLPAKPAKSIRFAQSMLCAARPLMRGALGAASGEPKCRA